MPIGAAGEYDGWDEVWALFKASVILVVQSSRMDLVKSVDSVMESKQSVIFSGQWVGGAEILGSCSDIMLKWFSSIFFLRNRVQRYIDTERKFRELFQAIHCLRLKSWKTLFISYFCVEYTFYLLYTSLVLHLMAFISQISGQAQMGLSICAIARTAHEIFFLSCQFKVKSVQQGKNP